MRKIDRFDGDFDFLSNFFPAGVRFDGILYPSSEAAFQAQKCFKNDDKLQFTHLTPGQAKRLGRKVYMRPDWENIIEKYNPDDHKEMTSHGEEFLPRTAR